MASLLFIGDLAKDGGKEVINVLSMQSMEESRHRENTKNMEKAMEINARKAFDNRVSAAVDAGNITDVVIDALERKIKGGFFPKFSNLCKEIPSLFENDTKVSELAGIFGEDEATGLKFIEAQAEDVPVRAM